MDVRFLRARLKFHKLVEFGKAPLGALALALIGLALAVYATWFNDKRPGMGYALALQTPVLSPHAVGDAVSIQIDGRPVDVSRTPLMLLFVRFWNSGDTTFRATDFDKVDPVGFKVNGGRVLRGEIVAAGSEYLAKALAAQVKDQRVVTVLPAILEPGDAFVLRALVVQDSATSAIAITPIGKVAGVREFEEFYPETAESPDVIVRYRSRNTARTVLLLVAALTLANLAHAIYRWWQTRATRRIGTHQSRDDA